MIQHCHESDRTCVDANLDTLGNSLCQQIGVRKFSLWFQDNAHIEIVGAEVLVTAQSKYAADWIDRHFRGELIEIARAVLGEQAAVTIRTQASLARVQSIDPTATGETRAPRELPSSRQSKLAAPRKASGGGDDAGHGWKRFEDFLAGPPNRLAFESARQIAECDDDPTKLLFLHGSCGVGKTHLLQSICRKFRERHPMAKVRYATGEQFTNDFIAAIRENNIEQFRRRTRRLELLVIDDVHFLGNKTATQSECLHTIDAIGFHGGRMVLASDGHPRQIAKFSAALVSRFLSGMVVKVDDADRATRMALARQFAIRRGLALPPAAIETLVDRTGTSIREIEGAVMTVAALHSLGGMEMGNGQILVERALGRTTVSHAGRPVRVMEILHAVCTTTGVERDDLVGVGRHRRIVTARGLAAHLAREMTTLSFPEIAKALGRSSHSTVHAAASRYRSMIDQSQLVEARSDHLTAADLSERTRREVLRTRI